MTPRHLLLLLALTLACATGSAHAGKACDNLRAAIDAKLQAKGVRGYSLDIVGAADVGSAKVVGECEGGAKRIVYARGSGGRANVAGAGSQVGKSAPKPEARAATPAPAPVAKPAIKSKSPPPALGNY